LSARRTLRDVGERFFSDPRLRLLVERYATDQGSDPRRAPSWLCIRPYVEHTFRAWTVAGGMRVLVEALHQRAVERGVVVRTGAHVVAVTTAAGRVDGVRLADGEVLPADIVVSTVEQPPSGRTEPSTSVFTLMLGLRGQSTDMARRTLLFPLHGDAELDDVFGDPARPVDEPTLSLHISRDAAHAPAGDEAWTIQVVAPRHGSGPGAAAWTDDVADDYAQRLVDDLALRGIEVRDRIVASTHRSPADIEKATAVTGGAAYGVALHGRRAAWSPAGNVSSMPGLFLAGAWAHPGGGVPSVTMSAAIVAEQVSRA
jgi:phytoene dehydrogenase-like protein